jgi:hypothetical protein
VWLAVFVLWWMVDTDVLAVFEVCDEFVGDAALSVVLEVVDFALAGALVVSVDFLVLSLETSFFVEVFVWDADFFVEVVLWDVVAFALGAEVVVAVDMVAGAVIVLALTIIVSGIPGIPLLSSPPWWVSTGGVVTGGVVVVSPLGSVVEPFGVPVWSVGSEGSEPEFVPSSVGSGAGVFVLSTGSGVVFDGGSVGAPSVGPLGGSGSW